MSVLPFSDPNLPDLATALDVNAVIEMLEHALPECREKLKIISGKVADVLYDPGVSCTLLYRFKVKMATGVTGQLLLFGRLLRKDQSPPFPPEHLVERFGKSHKEGIQTPVINLPEARLILNVFPLDESLPWLFDALDQQTVKEALERMFAPRNLRIHEVKIEPLGYIPRWRAALIYDLKAEAVETGKSESYRLVGKMHSHKGAARRFAGAWALWRAAGGRVNFALPVGYLGSLHIALQEYLDAGERLGKLVGSPSFVGLLRQTADQIRTLHHLSIPLSSYRTPQNEAQVVLRWEKTLMAIRPDLAKRINRICRKLTAGLEARTQMTGPVHGDFQNTNVLVDDSRITLIDLDEMAFGDPLVDLGRLLSSLRIPFLRKFGSFSVLEEARAAFLDEYFAMSARDEQRIRLFEAASLIITAAFTFRKQRDHWTEEIALVLDECDKVLQWAEPVDFTAIPPVRETSRPLIAYEDRVRWATDGRYIQAVMDPFIQEQFGAELTDCQVLAKYETEVRCRIRYGLSGWRDRKRWESYMHGMLWKEYSGWGHWHRLEVIFAALQGGNHGPLLPQPVAYLPSLQTMMMKVPAEKITFTSLIGTPRAMEAATRIGLSLASLHSLRIESGTLHSLQDHVLNLQKKTKKLERIRPDLSSRTAVLFSEVAGQTKFISERVAPVLRILQPSHIFYEEEQVTFIDVEMLTFSHPLIDVGNFLARLAMHGMQSGKVQEAAEAANRFYRSYFEAMNIDPDGLEVFEAAALLGLACREVETEHNSTMAESLLTRAMERLAKQSRSGPRS